MMKWNELSEKQRKAFIAKGLRRDILEGADYYEAENGEYMMVV